MHVGYEVFHYDVGELVRFYVSVLGFEALPSEEEHSFVVVRRDMVRVACAFHQNSFESPANRRPPLGSEIVLRVDDVDAEHERAQRAGWLIADPLVKQSWGLRDFRIFDPSGQYLRITENARREKDAGAAGVVTPQCDNMEWQT
jgi:uncharacterized glyoxalase superfamily protein PhnB